ncbi:MAG: PAS domain S-box protein [Desulfomonile tiedjei]|nr:PAS domain S-box protein [Desulfomonile tiedjei]
MNILWRTVSLVVPEGTRDGPEFRKRVEWMMLLRLVVTTLLLGATIFFQFRESRAFFVDPTVPLYILVAATFLLSLIYVFSLPLAIDLWAFSFFQIIVDVFYVTIVIYFTGGASSVFTLLYLFPIIASAILHYRRGALIIASMASVLFGLLLNLEFYHVIPAADWPWMSPWSRNTPGYILWVLVVHVTFFYFIAVVASSVAEQLQSTRISLRRKESDYTRLSDLHTGIVRSIPSGIVTTDENDRITFVNTAGSALLGSPLPDLVSLPLRNIFPVIDDQVRTSAMRRETYRTVKDIHGEKKHLELVVSDLKDRDGVPTGRLVVFQDVTDIRKMEERVSLSERQAAFVRIAARMAHEIRNPLASLRGATELLAQTSGSVPTERRLLDIVIRESDRLNSLLGEFLLTVSDQPPRKIRVLLTDLVEETVDLFAREPRVSGKVSLETRIHKGVEVEGEPARLRQALWNLLTNALDATPDGGVIRVVLESEPSSKEALVKVQDSGVGIPLEIRDRIFEPFTTTKEKGTGLGLSLVLSVAKAHGGTVDAESSPGALTVFTLRLPLATNTAIDDTREQRHG